MTPIKLFLAASAAAFITSPVLAGDGEKAEIVSEDSEKADHDATVRCKRLAPPVGTRMPGKKVCKTNAAWRLEKEAARDAARESQDRSATGNTRSNGWSGLEPLFQPLLLGSPCSARCPSNSSSYEAILRRSYRRRKLPGWPSKSRRAGQGRYARNSRITPSEPA